MVLNMLVNRTPLSPSVALEINHRLRSQRRAVHSRSAHQATIGPLGSGEDDASDVHPTIDLTHQRADLCSRDPREVQETLN
jgi:hypothetical protein